VECSDFLIASVKLFDITGASVNTPLTPLKSGYTATIDMRGISSGIYFLHIEMSNGERVVKKVLKE
jgi:hypothetical protein